MVVRSMGKTSTTHWAYTWGRKQKKKGKKNICVAKKWRQLTEKKQEQIKTKEKNFEGVGMENRASLPTAVVGLLNLYTRVRKSVEV